MSDGRACAAVTLMSTNVRVHYYYSLNTHAPGRPGARAHRTYVRAYMRR